MPLEFLQSRRALPTVLTAGLFLLAACAGPAPDPARGETVYAARCASCHGGRDGKAPDPKAPPHTNEGHTWHHGDAQLAGIITGELRYPGRTMPAFGGELTDQDIRDVLAYLNTWWGPEQQAAQREATRNERSR